MPARQALNAELVPAHLLRSAVTLNTASLNFSAISGPALAGVLLSIPWIGLAGVFWIVTLMHLEVLITMLRLGRHHGAATDVAFRRRGGLSELAEGLRHIGSSPMLRTLLGLAFAALLLGQPYLQLMPLFADRVFGVGPAGLGILVSASGAGALVGALSVAAMTGVRRHRAVLAGYGMTFGVSLICFALAPTFSIAVAILALVGFGSAGYASLNNALMIEHSEPRLHGRVMSVYLFGTALTPLGTLPLSWLADRSGAPITVCGAGIVLLAIFSLAALRVRFSPTVS
jgi:predicted MFS family arabinose efflux permease